MCGIFGYVGNKYAYNEIYDGLKKLEYRGYDSCGISVIDKLKFKTIKKVGGPEELKLKSKSKSTIGIGHTRWATHGTVNVKNAHPHVSSCGRIVLVHNGVIENSDSHKWCKLVSDTDSEVLANLIAREYHHDDGLVHAVEGALSKIEGTYGIAVMCIDQPGTIVAARRGSPLVIGIGNDETYIASDTYALPPDISRVIYLDDGQIAVITSDDVKIRKAEQTISPTIADIQHKYVRGDKGQYKTFLEKEIREQPVAIRNAMRGRFNKEFTDVKFGGIKLRKKVRRVLFLGCGTAYHAGLVGKYLVESIAGVPASVEYSSEYKYKNNPTEDGTLIVAISQSGETLDTLTAIEEAQSHDRMVISITNVVASSIARMTDMGIYQHAGPEVSVASSKAFTSQLTILAMLAIYIGRKHNLSKVQAKRYISQLRKLPALVEKTLDVADELKSMSNKWINCNAMAFLDRQLMYPIAIEGALNPAGELKHGPLASIGFHSTCLYLAPQKELFDKNVSNMKEIKARDSHIILITQEGLDFPEDTYDNVIYVPKAPEILQPILAVIPLQFFSMYMAQVHNYNVDRPRHLAKSVTVE